MSAAGGGGGGGAAWGMIAQYASQMLDAGLTARFNSKEAAQSRNFQEAAMKNRIRWAVEDAKRAGINPLTMFMQGGVPAGGASGASASMSRGTGFDAVRAGAEAERAFRSGRKETAREMVEKETVNLVKQQAEAARFAAERDASQAYLNDQSGRESAERERYYKFLADTQRSSSLIEASEVPAAINKRQVEEKMGEKLRWIDRAAETVGKAFGGGRRR